MHYSKDTRTIEPGDVYVAIEGETYDGHDFIPEAIEKGASGVVTAQDIDVPSGVDVIRVEDTLDYLTDQASQKIDRLDPDIIAITGSMGKTSTKMALLAVLGQAFEVVASEGNKNTPLGLSLLVLNRDITPDTKLVLEMGVRFKGDLKELCSYFPPTISIVTNVRRVHIETLGSIEAVQREKSEIVRALGKDGIACLNGDDERVLDMDEVNDGRTITYGTNADCDVQPKQITATMPSLGEPALYTGLGTLSVGLALDMPASQINAGLEKMEPEKGRLNRLRGREGSTLIDDSYNSSPEAVRAALGVLAELENEQSKEGDSDQTRRIAFLGDMLELGETEVEKHASILSEALEEVDVLHAVGELMAQGAETLSPKQRRRITLHGNSSDLAEALQSGSVYTPRSGDVILVKGSQGRRMERISEALLHPDLNPKDVLPRQSGSWKQKT